MTLLKRQIILFFFLLLSFYLVSGSVNSASQTYDEYAIKTAFLFRSLHYVEWSKKNSSDNLIVICITDPDNFSKTIYSLRHRTVNGRTIELRNLASLEEIQTCDILHLPMMKSSQLHKTLAKIENNNILTISDQPGFAKSGVILNFPLDGQKVTIEVNVDAANRQNIKFSAKLLRIAKIIGNK